jgi:hypothetical protein
VNRRHQWRRGDGTVLSCLDLVDAVPMMLDELDDIKRLVNVLEDWLRFEESACYLLSDWLLAINCDPGPQPPAQGVIDELGALGVKLHRILSAGIPDTGHTHPPASPQGR